MLDTSCGDEYEKKLKDYVSAQDDVVRVDVLRSRMFGSKIYIDLEIEVDGDKSLRESHAVAERVHSSVERNFTDIKHKMCIRDRVKDASVLPKAQPLVIVKAPAIAEHPAALGYGIVGAPDGEHAAEIRPFRVHRVKVEVSGVQVHRFKAELAVKVAVEIARKIGLPEDVIADASEIVGSEYLSDGGTERPPIRRPQTWQPPCLAVSWSHRR